MLGDTTEIAYFENCCSDTLSKQTIGHRIIATMDLHPRICDGNFMKVPGTVPITLNKVWFYVYDPVAGCPRDLIMDMERA